MDTARTAPASAADHVDALPPGTRLGEFELTALLGVGGFGLVYQAFDHSLLRFVAIKEYMPAALAGRADGQSLWVRSSADEPSFQAGLASFVSEARLLAQFDHPSLVKVFRFWEANRTAYMVMPLYSGMTLKQARAHMRTPPSEQWLRALLWSMAGALRVLHDGQTLHRDISPDNIFLQDNGPPVLLDLGAARRAIRERDGHYTAVLKVNYAPIEQYADAASALRQGPWSDLYSLGAVVHGCLCNDAPLPATLRAVRDRMVPFARVARTVHKQFGVPYSPAFVQAVSQCLALQPEDRPQSVDAFLQALEMTAAPLELEHFDFRAALGDAWVEPSEGAAPGVAAGAPIDLSLLSQPYTAPRAPASATPATPPAPDRGPARASAPEDPASAFADTVAAEWSSTVLLEPEPPLADPPAPGGEPAGRATAPQTRPPASRRRWLLLALAASLLVLAAAWQLLKPQQPRYTPESEIITELAPGPQPGAQAAPPEAPLDAASQPDGAPAALAGSEQAAAAPAAAAAPPAPARAVRPARPAAPLEAAAPVPAPPPTSVPEPPPARAPAAPPAAPAALVGPDEACASAGFLARSMCIYQECQKAALARHPTCVTARRRQEEEARQRQLYPQ